MFEPNGEYGLEIDLLNCGLGHQMCEAFQELGASDRWVNRFKGLVETGSEVSNEDAQAVLRRIDRLGKGRFAQRLAEKVTKERCPPYIEAAILDIVGQLGHVTE